MADNKTPPGDKSRKSRSFGSFAILMVVLAAMLVIWGGTNALTRPSEFTQDQYLWHLYTGEVSQQEFKGTTQVEGRLRSGTEFRASFADIKASEATWREVNASGPIRDVSTVQLERAINEGWYQPLSARLLTSRIESSAETTPGEESNGVVRQTQPFPSQADRLLVKVLARPLSSYKEKNAGEPPFPLQASSGTLWLNATDSNDFVALLGNLKLAPEKVETLAFNLSKDKGTRWSELSSVLTTALLMLGPWLLVLIVIFIIMRQMRNQSGAGGVMSFGRSRAQLYSKENHTNVTFDDVAGADEAKDEVKEIVEFLKNPGRFTRLGGRIPRGVLLVGSPGCGKTLLAKAIAGEAEVPFFSISGSDFVEMFVGVGASRVRDLFKQARENSPCIIFLDEIDAVGRRRGSGMGGGHDEREQTLNAILVEMDGFGTDEGIIVIAATNRPDVLDPALLRPGRFDREVTIDLPDVKGREQILRVHLKKVKAGSDVDVAALARSAPGRSGAQLAAIINEAAIMAALQKKDEISMEHLEEARDKVSYGRQKRSRQLEEADRKITAYHESGHAVVASMIPDVDPPTKVTIVPRGQALGVTFMIPDKESYHFQRRRMVGQLAVAFGGRVAESVFCGDISAGASDDIRRATELARAMVTELGMSDRIGPINYAERQGSDFLGTELMSAKWHSEATAREIDEEIQRFLKEAYETALRIVRDNAPAVENITQALLRYENVSGDDIRKLIAGATVESLRPGFTAPVRPTPGPKSYDPGASRVQPGQDAGELPGTPGLSPA